MRDTAVVRDTRYMPLEWAVGFRTLDCTSAIQIPEHREENAMHDRLLRRRDVERITGMSRASIYRLMQQGDFPRPVKVGSTAVRWKESDIAAWIESRSVATSELGSNAA